MQVSKRESEDTKQLFEKGQRERVAAKSEPGGKEDGGGCCSIPGSLAKKWERGGNKQYESSTPWEGLLREVLA